MMRGRLYIDGNDAFLQYGVYVVDGGWKDLVALPPLKALTYNDWQEEDGIEADMSSPVLNTREVTLDFAIRGAASNFSSFTAFLSGGAVHEFDCAEIGRTFHLRLTSQGRLDYYSTLGFLSLKFADDYPFEGYSYQSPTGGNVADSTAYKIDGVNLTAYGVRVLEGSIDEVLKVANVKSALLRNIPSRGGVIYDTQAQVTFGKKDVKLNCLLTASTLAEMWRNIQALGYNITQPGAHVLSVEETGGAYDFVYKSCSISSFDFQFGRVWLEFALTLTFIN